MGVFFKTNLILRLGNYTIRRYKTKNTGQDFTELRSIWERTIVIIFFKFDFNIINRFNKLI